jgi:hypothetical protein
MTDTDSASGDERGAVRSGEELMGRKSGVLARDNGR